MKVYVITKGEYSDYHICAVAIDKDKAETLKRLYSEYSEEACIEEFDTNDSEGYIKFKHFYSCQYHESYSKLVVYETEPDYVIDEKAGHVSKARYGLHLYVYAKDKEHAFKIASDKFAQYKAEQMNL